MPTASLAPARGFHPVLSTSVDAPSDVDCTLSAVFVLPPAVIVDRHQLRDQLADGRLVTPATVRPSISIYGTRDIELPVHAVPHNASVVVLRFARIGADRLRVDLPLHLRYATPVAERKAMARVSIPSPIWIESCSGASLVAANELRQADSAALGDCLHAVVPATAWPDLPATGRLLDPITHCPSSVDELSQLIASIPTGSSADARWVGPANALIVCALALYVARAALLARGRLRRQAAKKAG